MLCVVRHRRLRWALTLMMMPRVLMLLMIVFMMHRFHRFIPLETRFWFLSLYIHFQQLTQTIYSVHRLYSCSVVRLPGQTCVLVAGYLAERDCGLTVV